MTDSIGAMPISPWSILPAGADTWVNLASYGIIVEGHEDTGMPPLDQIATTYAVLPGASWQRTKVQPRMLALRCRLIGATRPDYHARRAALIRALAPDRAGAALATGIRYDRGDGTILEIAGRIADGLRRGAVTGQGSELLPLRFYVEAPYWHATTSSSVGPTSVALAALTASTVYRRADDGAWAAVGQLGAAAQSTRAFAVAPNGDLYAGGNWTTANSGATLVNRVARLNGSTWEALGGGGLPHTPGVSGVVNALAAAPDGTIYLGGYFTTAWGTVAVNHITRYDPDTDTFSALGGGTPGVNGEVHALAYDPVGGRLYLGGDFTTAGGATVNRVASYDPDTDTFNALGSAPGANNTIYSLLIVPALSLRLYLAGAVTAADGVTVNRVALWDGSAMTSPGSPPFAAAVRGMALGPDGASLVAVADGTAARWDESNWSVLGDLLAGGAAAGDACLCVAVDADDQAYVGTADGVPGLRRWGGAAWGGDAFHNVEDVLALAWDADGQLLLGTADTVTPFTAFALAVDVAGSAAVAPTITLVSAGAACISIRNATTGHELRFPDQATSLFLATSETIVIDCAARTITSDLRGDMAAYLLDGSDLAAFVLVPGANDIRVLAGLAAAVTIAVAWTDQYWSLDG